MIFNIVLSGQPPYAGNMRMGGGGAVGGPMGAAGQPMMGQAGGARGPVPPGADEAGQKPGGLPHGAQAMQPIQQNGLSKQSKISPPGKPQGLDPVEILKERGKTEKFMLVLDPWFSHVTSSCFELLGFCHNFSLYAYKPENICRSNVDVQFL